MPLASNDIFEEVLLKLSVLRYIVSSGSKLGKYDLNKQAERFFMDLLNLVEGWNLVDLNTEKKNTAVIDLGDRAAKICVQVTAETSSTKIKDTIAAFIENGLYKNYTRLVFIMVAGKKSYSTEFGTDEKFHFNPNNDILDIDDLLGKIEALKLDKLRQVGEFVGAELAPIVAALAPPNSLLHKVEPEISRPAKSAKQFLKYFGYEAGDDWNDELENLNNFYESLSKLSREEREYLFVIMTRGKATRKFGTTRYRIAPSTLKSMLTGVSAVAHFAVLEEAGFASTDDDHPPTIDIYHSMESGEDFFVSLGEFCKGDKKKLEQILVDGNFTLLD